MNDNVLVIGIGEIGKPLLELLSERYSTYELDLGPHADIPPCGIMHICFPYKDATFVDECVRYIEKFPPELAIINSTVAPGTTRQVAERTGAAVVHSPVLGKHARMKEEMLRYTKFVGSLAPEAGEEAARHFTRIGIKVKQVSPPEVCELAKLTETTYFGVLIAWAQEVERYCKDLDVDYDEVVSFYEEIGFFPPVKFFPGVIGGHCVLPNIRILKQHFSSGLLDALEKSNELKTRGLGTKNWADILPPEAG